jgi:prephenate dehydratase
MKTLKRSNQAAIASSQAAELYGMNVLKSGITDRSGITRYFLLSTKLAVPQRHMDPKTSIHLTMKNQVYLIFITAIDWSVL